MPRSLEVCDSRGLQFVAKICHKCSHPGAQATWQNLKKIASPARAKNRSCSRGLTVVCSRCRLNLKFGNFTLLFGRLRQRIVLKCVPHVQHDYFCSFNQLDHCFRASLLTLLSTLLKLPSTDGLHSIEGQDFWVMDFWPYCVCVCRL